MPGCITQDYKDILVNMLAAEVDRAVMRGFVQFIPTCEPSAPVSAVKEAVKRKSPEIWGLQPVYVDEKGDEEVFSSPSALVSRLGLTMSGIQCDEEGNKCKALNVVDILRSHGYVVRGNGEDPAKASQGGKQFLVWNPHAPQLQTAIKEAEAKPKRKKK